MSTANKEMYLENGSEYADLRWGMRLKASLLKLTQALQFPRSGLSDRYGRPVIGVPTDWKKAVCEYTMQSTKGPLLGSTTSSEAGLKKKKTVVGPITTEKEFTTDSSSSSTYTSYPKADMLVKAYLKAFSGNGGSVMRN